MPFIFDFNDDIDFNLNLENISDFILIFVFVFIVDFDCFMNRFSLFYCLFYNFVLTQNVSI